MKTRGFTLIELLAVIVLLAIIALIVVPTVLNIINSASKNTFKDSAYGIIKAGELYYTNQVLESENTIENKIFVFPNVEELEIKGSKPSGGTMLVTKEGRIGLAINNGKYCAKKGYMSEEITIDENINNCTIPSIITSEDNCIKDTNATCTNGTKVEVRVNDNDTYGFYVIRDTKEELTLMLDKNIQNDVEWINQVDYVEFGGNITDYGNNGNNSKGPITALKVIENKTSIWVNIPMMTYMLIDDGGGNRYNSITRNHVRARMLTITEAQQIKNSNNGVLPNYLYNSSASASEAYWLSSAYIDDSNNAMAMVPLGVIGKYLVHNNNGAYGVRPVIVLSKNS